MTDQPYRAKGVKSEHKLLRQQMQRVRNLMKHLDSLRDFDSQQAKQALGGLRRRVGAFQHTLDKPSPGVEHSYLLLCRGFISSAQIFLIKYTARIQPERRTGPMKKSPEGSSTTRLQNPKAKTYTTSAKLTEIMEEFGRKGPEEAGSEADRNALDPLLVDRSKVSSGVVITPSHQDNTLSTPADSPSMIQKRIKYDAEVHAKLDKQPINYKTHNTLQTATLAVSPGKAGTSPSDTSLHSSQKDMKNDADILQGLRPLAAKPKDLSSSGNPDELFWNGVLEAAMNCRDNDLWYDPRVDFEEDLLP